MNQIIFIGDIHGKIATLNYLIHDRYKLSNAILIQVGDFGMGYHLPGYYQKELGALNTALEANNNNLYVIRGNHDDPSYFKETNNPFGYKNIIFLADWSELTLNGKNILFVGGAVSIDRCDNIEGQTWWPDEIVVYKKDFDYKKYDYVVTHTRPGCCGSFKGFGPIQYWLDRDYKLKNDIIAESDLMDVIYENTKPAKWIYGHFHRTNAVQYENTLFRCVDINEFYAT